jgi:hypothetical protein
MKLYGTAHFAAQPPDLRLEWMIDELKLPTTKPSA